MPFLTELEEKRSRLFLLIFVPMARLSERCEPIVRHAGPVFRFLSEFEFRRERDPRIQTPG